MHAQQSQPLPGWVAPALVAATAIPTFAAFWIGGNPRTGLVWAAVALAFAAVLALGTRIEALRILAGVDDDERTRDVDRRATAAMGMVLVLALVVCFLGSALAGRERARVRAPADPRGGGAAGGHRCPVASWLSARPSIWLGGPRSR